MKQLMKAAALTGLLPLLLPATAPAQAVTPSLASLVRITCNRSGEPRPPGSGFVVAIKGNRATIVTASHVVEGASCEVEFTFSADRMPVERILGLEAGDPHGLAALRVRGIPKGVEVLELDAERPVELGEPLLLAGFPQMASRPRVKQGVFSGPEGKLLLVDRPAGEGASGGPVLRGGKAVGVITAGGVGEEYTYAVGALVARAILTGWDIQPGVVTPVATRPPPLHKRSSTPECRSGDDERTFEGIEFVRICAGNFKMGSLDDDESATEDEKPQHATRLSEFWIARTETSNRQYRRLHPDHKSGHADNLPAVYVNWHDAKAFCEEYGARLPPHAEWEYGARAGNPGAWTFGNSEKDLEHYAWYSANSGGMAHAVGTRKANAWGLHDMHGNAWEWVADWFGPYSKEAQTDPPGPDQGSLRVLRGGAFHTKPSPDMLSEVLGTRFRESLLAVAARATFTVNVGNLRSADRNGVEPRIRSNVIGFRCARNSRLQP